MNIKKRVSDFFSSLFVKRKNKRGAEIEEIVKIIIMVVVLIVMVVGVVFLLKIKGGATLEGIKNLLHFGK